MGERFWGVFFQNFLKIFLNAKKPPIFLKLEVNRRLKEMFIIYMFILWLINGKVLFKSFHQAHSFTFINI